MPTALVSRRSLLAGAVGIVALPALGAADEGDDADIALKIDPDLPGWKLISGAMPQVQTDRANSEYYVITLDPVRGGGASCVCESPPFRITGSRIRLHVAGSAELGADGTPVCYVGLAVDGKVVRRASGVGDAQFRRAEWDVPEHMGQVANLVLVDAARMGRSPWVALQGPVTMHTPQPAFRPTDWPQWRGPDRNGIAPEGPTLAASWPSGGPRLVWHRKGLGYRGDGHMGDNGWSCPVVAGNRVYLFLHSKARSESAGPYQDRFLCLDAGSGETIWHQAYPSKRPYYNATGTPSVVGDRLFGTGNNTVYCFEAASGNLVWKRSVDIRVIHSSVLVTEGIVIVSAGKLYGMSARTGRVRWTLDADPGTYPPLLETSSPCLWHTGAAKRLIWLTSNVVCVDPRSGLRVWRHPVRPLEKTGGKSGPIDGTSPVVADNVLYITRETNRLAAFALTLNGTDEKWSIAGIDSCACPIVLGDHIYEVGGNLTTAGRARCIAKSDARVVWEHPVPHHSFSSPVCADEKLIFFMDEGRKLGMMRASPSNPRLLASMELPTSEPMLYSSPAISAGRLYVRTSAYDLACYDLTA